MESDIKPIIEKIKDNPQELQKFQEALQKNPARKKSEILLQFPTVYIHNWKNTKDYEIYIGESMDIVKRTKEHYASSDKEDAWQRLALSTDASLYIIGHEHFNKSMTLDIENRLMQYMMSVERVRRVHNQKKNPQNRYYPDSETDAIFQKIWGKLRRDNKELFPKESMIKDSAVFKASPLHKLTKEQEEIQQLIIKNVQEALQTGKRNQLIFIDGEAGTGKTVLNSSTFYEIYSIAEELKKDSLKCFLLVNHDEQLLVYEQIAQKLGLTDRYGEVVSKPTSFINHHSKENPVDIVFVDEAHLLLTQGKQSYQGENQLRDIMERAKVTVVMFDENQILRAEQYWEAQILAEYRELAKEQNHHFELTEQLRIRGSEEVMAWIDGFTKQKKVSKLPVNTGDYEIRIFEKPEEMEREVRKKASDKKHQLSRILATYDWEYSSNSSPAAKMGKYWEVMIGRWHKPWNRELDKGLDRKTKRKNKTLAWAEQPQTIGEVGSTFTIQGFDLNYAGVILGPSVKYREGKIVFDPSASHNKKAVQNRTLSDGTKQRFGETLIQHEVRVLMTRGVEGLYIYACDEELRKALLDAAK